MDISSDKVVIFVLLKKIPPFEFSTEGPCDLYKFDKTLLVSKELHPGHLFPHYPLAKAWLLFLTGGTVF